MLDADKLIINAAVTGMVPTKADSSAVPITVEEILADVKRCHDAGAAIVHVHARDEQGQPSMDAAIYGRIIAGIRQACPGMVISVSTSGRCHKLFEQRSAPLACVPDLASLTPGSLNFPHQASVNEPDMIERLARVMSDFGIKPELEFFELGMIDFVRDCLMRKNIIRAPLYANLLLGSRGTMAATPENLLTMVRALPPQTTWSAAGIGRFQFSINALAIVMGGHVRVGLEDNLYYDRAKTQLATNPGLIDRVVGVARAVGRDIATPDDARGIMGLRSQADPQATPGS